MAFFSFRQHGYRARQRGRPPTLLLKQQSSVAGLTIGRTRRRRARWGLWSILFLLLLRIQQWTIGNSFDFFDTQQLTLSPHGEPFANKVNNRQNLLSYIHKSNPRKDPDPKTIAKLQNAGLDMSSLDNETLQLIPEWSTIEDILGSSTPHILGLDTCQTFRSIVQNEPRYIGVSGFFNSGTNLLAHLLGKNCNFPESQEQDEDQGRTLWAVPWGKHSRAIARDIQTVPRYADYNKTKVLTAIMVRSPFDVLESMCRNSYSVHYQEAMNSTCPYMVDPQTGELLPVDVGLKLPRTRYPSILHFWNEWYREYLHDFEHPRLFIRLEDLAVHPRETVEAICECAGGTVSDDFQFKLTNPKEGMGHGKESEKNGLIEAWTRLGHAISFPSQDYEAVKTHLDTELMTNFLYRVPPRSTE